jgi:hypothetical protein
MLTYLYLLKFYGVQVVILSKINKFYYFCAIFFIKFIINFEWDML